MPLTIGRRNPAIVVLEGDEATGRRPRWLDVAPDVDPVTFRVVSTYTDLRGGRAVKVLVVDVGVETWISHDQWVLFADYHMIGKWRWVAPPEIVESRSEAAAIVHDVPAHAWYDDAGAEAYRCAKCGCWSRWSQPRPPKRCGHCRFEGHVSAPRKATAQELGQLSLLGGS